eukprot:1112780-Prorocentrum_minimum.AAC.2
MFSDVLTDHSLSRPSLPVVSSCVPAVTKESLSTLAVWPSNVRRQLPSLRDHSRTVRSADAVPTTCGAKTVPARSDARYGRTDVQTYRRTDVQWYRRTDVQWYSGTDEQTYSGTGAVPLRGLGCPPLRRTLRFRGKEAQEPCPPPAGRVPAARSDSYSGTVAQESGPVQCTVYSVQCTVQRYSGARVRAVFVFGAFRALAKKSLGGGLSSPVVESLDKGLTAVRSPNLVGGRELDAPDAPLVALEGCDGDQVRKPPQLCGPVLRARAHQGVVRRHRHRVHFLLMRRLPMTTGGKGASANRARGRRRWSQSRAVARVRAGRVGCASLQFMLRLIFVVEAPFSRLFRQEGEGCFGQ